MPSVEAKATATRLGSYEILHMFAKGGMAELYIARSVGPAGFEKLVVLKRILPHFAQNAKFVRLFLDEAKLAASLDHPNIAHVYDLGLVDGNYFFTMEYVHGQDVRRVLHRLSRAGGKLPIDHVVQVARSVASALHYAHERRGPDGKPAGIVHRDVSPSNIVVSYEGTVKLLDFGVAKAATSTVKTRTGTLKGKVSYMSPEQAKGLPIDRRSDIFSAGIVMWEMIASHRLFKAENDLATLQLVIHRPTQSLIGVRPDCPPELDRIVQKALAQDPAERYQTAQELQSDLDELARERKLKQSSISLAQHMSALFEKEIKAWEEARAAGVSFTDHVIATSATRSGEPATTSNPFGDEDDEEESVDEASLGNPVVEDERTEQTAPPTAPPTLAPPPTLAAQPPAAAKPAKPKKKRAKEPKNWQSEPSIVLDDSIAKAVANAEHDEESTDVLARSGVFVPPAAEIEPPGSTDIDVAEMESRPTAAIATPEVVLQRASSAPRVEAALPTQLMEAVPDPFAKKSRAGWWIAAGIAIAAGVAGIVVVSKQRHSEEPTSTAASSPSPAKTVDSTETQPESAAKPDESNAAGKADDSKPESASKPDESNPASASNTKTDSNPEAKPASVSKTESNPEAKPASVSKTESKSAESKPDSKAASVSKTESKPAVSKTESKPVESKPDSKVAAKPIESKVDEPKPVVVTKVDEPKKTKPAPKPVAKPKPVTKPKPKPKFDPDAPLPPM